MDIVMASATEDQRLPPSRCHESRPVGRRLPTLTIQVGELADVMDFHVLGGATRLAFVRQESLKQLGTPLTLAGEERSAKCAVEARPEWYPAEAGDQRLLPLSRDSGLQTRPGPERGRYLRREAAPPIFATDDLCLCPTFSVATSA